MTLAERLRVLQKQVGRGAAPRPPSDALSLQLRRLLGVRAVQRQRTPLAAPAGTRLADGLYLVQTRWPSDAPAQLHLPGPDTTAVARERLVCFDTETTGLAGGVGTKAFMLGLAQWQGGQLLVRQLYLTALAGEAAMLDTFAAWLAPDSILVSYNGRSYDAPLLKGRYRLQRREHPFEDRPHLDLLHAVRRAFRGVWANCRLATVERELLGIVREDDLPGAQAPAAWLAFLRGEGSSDLGRVIDHNRQDLRSLAALLQWFGTPRWGEAGATAACAV